MFTIRLIWKRDGEDVELGTCYQTVRPGVGELIAYTSEHAQATCVWKVVLVYHQPFMYGSQKWNNWRINGEQPSDMTCYWVEPAEGPWSP